MRAITAVPSAGTPKFAATVATKTPAYPALLIQASNAISVVLICLPVNYDTWRSSNKEHRASKSCY